MPTARLRIRLTYLFSLMLLLLSFAVQADDGALQIIQRHLVPDTRSPAANSFLPPEQAFRVSSLRSEHGFYIELQAAPGYYFYRDRIHLSQGGNDITPHVQFSEPQQKDDPAFGRVAVYHGEARIALPQEKITSSPIEVRYQGCADAGLCYPPMQKTLRIAEPTIDQAQPLPAPIKTVATANTPSSLSFWTLLTLYAAGIGLIFTPCVLPMLPIACAIVVGRNASRKQAMTLSITYVGGMMVAYALLGALVGLFGSSLQLQAQLQRPWVLIPMAAACVAAAGWLFDLYQLRLPLRLSMRLQGMQDGLHQQGLVGTFVTGALSTLVLSPCLSAPLAGVLVYLSTTGHLATSMLGLMALALGMGTPIIICCTFGAGFLPRAGAWMTTVKGMFGLILLGTALWLLDRLLTPSCALLLWGIWGLGVARLLGVGLSLQQGLGALLQIISWAITTWSIACIIGAAAGGYDPIRPLAPFSSASQKVSEPENAVTPRWPRLEDTAALQRAIEESSGRPLLVDIYADWCISCQRMERTIYSAPELQPILSVFQGFRLDITHPDEKTLEFLRQHGLFGPPGLLFFVSGQEAVNERIVGEQTREEVEKHLHAVLSTTSYAPPRIQP